MYYAIVKMAYHLHHIETAIILNILELFKIYKK